MTTARPDAPQSSKGMTLPDAKPPPDPKARGRHVLLVNVDYIVKHLVALSMLSFT